jgi:hypothetical protein
MKINNKNTQRTRNAMKEIIQNAKSGRSILALALVTLGTLAATAMAGGSPPPRETYFICPSVSTHNAHGMWVMGAHGAYYVLVPTKGGANDGSKVFLTIPVQVTSLAQIPAGWALYKDVPSYPNFVGMVGLLAEGIETWLGSPAGWEEGDGAMVEDNGDGTYTVTNARLMESITINEPVPLASAAVW